MFCKNCGKQLNQGEKFCVNCGNKINIDNEIMPSTINLNNTNIQSSNNINNVGLNVGNNVNEKKKETLGTISMVIGIISLVLSFFVNILILPVAIVGLILGIINKVKKGKKISGIILNSISILISIVIMLLIAVIFNGVISLFQTPEFKDAFSDLYNELDYSTSSNFIAGKYDCTEVNGDTDEYSVTLHLNEDNTYLYGPYGNLENNYLKGTYTYEDENKTNGSGEYKYFMVTMEKEEYIVDGQSRNDDSSFMLEFGLTNKTGKKEGVIMFLSSYNMYYCYEN